MKKLIAFAFFFFVSYSLHAQTSQPVISYQGLIQGTDGAPIKDSTYPITILIWRDTMQGTPIWQDVFQTEVRGGVFNILLGSQSPLPAPSDMDHPLFISTSIGEASAAYPRSALSAVPLAINVADRAITTAKLADSSVTPQKMNMNYVSSISVNGQQVTGNGTALNIAGGDGVGVLFDPNTNSLYLSSAGTSVGTGKGGEGHVFATTPTPTPWMQGGDGAGDLNVDPSVLGSTSASYGVSIYSGNADRIDLPHGGGITLDAGLGGPGIILEPFGGVVGILHINSSGLLSDSAVNLASADVSGILQQTNGGTDTIPRWSTTLPLGPSNSATDKHTTVAGGAAGDADIFAATVGGGYYNNAYGDDGVVAGGESNQVGSKKADPNSYHSAIGGGAVNTAEGIGTAIPGGVSLTLGTHSFGFNGDNGDMEEQEVGINPVPAVPVITDLSDSGGNYSNVAFFGNVNLMLGNVDTNARELQFYSPNAGDHNFTPGSVFYSSFRAGTQSNNIRYTLPAANPAAGQVLSASMVTPHTGATPTEVTLTWSPAGGDSAGWLLKGNAGAPPPTNYLGTQDSEAFEIHIHNNTLDTTRGNRRVMRYEEGTTSPNILGGSSANTLGMELTGVAILSGGSIAYPNIISDSEKFCLIASGEGNLITGESEYSSIVGGRFNSIEASLESVVSGGYGNILSGDNSLIGSGFTDTLTGSASSIVGGTSNYLYGNQSTIAGGQGNQLYTGILGPSFLGGGQNNYLYTGLLSGPSFLGSGDSNVLTAGWATLGGGHRNIIDIGGEKGIIVGGCFNTVTQEWGIIVGGCGNTVTDTLGTIGGGQHNLVAGTLGTISGGDTNRVFGVAGTIGGGANNQVTAYFGAILGGLRNSIGALDSCGVISGGAYNTIDFQANEATIGGGYTNVVYGNRGTIGGGESNGDSAVRGTIGGGGNNGIRAIATNGTIGGGYDNLDSAEYGTIPGGYGLTAQSFAQFVAGTFNIPMGTSTFGSINGDDPLVIFGNGTSAGFPSNAWTLSNSGYSTAYDNIGSGGGAHPASTRMGSTYANNTIIACGYVGSNDTFAIADVGVAHVFHDTTILHMGTYVIHLNVVNTDGTPHTFDTSAVAITATIVEGATGGPGLITVTQLYTTPIAWDHWPITPQQPAFIIRTYNTGFNLSNTFAFQFHVIAP